LEEARNLISQDLWIEIKPTLICLSCLSPDRALVDEILHEVKSANRPRKIIYACIYGQLIINILSRISRCDNHVLAR
jgi:hypothetical protein